MNTVKITAILIVALSFASSCVMAQDLAFSCGKNGVLEDLQPYKKVHHHRKFVRDAGCLVSDTSPKKEPDSIFALGQNIVQSIQAWMHGKSNSGSDRDGNLDAKISRLEETAHDCQEPYEPAMPEETRFSKSSSKKVSISYPFMGLNQLKSGQYDRKALLNVIRHALSTGADPYLALAVVAQENPPVKMENFETYASKRGVIPVDQTGAYEQLGCFAKDRGSDRFPTLSNDDVTTYQKGYTAYTSARDAYQKAVKQNPWHQQYDDLSKKVAILKEKLADLSASEGKRPITSDPKWIQLRDEIKKISNF